MFAEDPDAYLRDFGSPVLFGSQGTMAIFEEPDMDVLHGRVQSTQYRITYPRSKLVGLGNNDTVLIGIGPGWGLDPTGHRLLYSGSDPINSESAQFRVMGSPDILDDGLFVEAKLQRV